MPLVVLASLLSLAAFFPGGGFASFHVCCRTRGSMLLAFGLLLSLGGLPALAGSPTAAAARVSCTPFFSNACSPQHGASVRKRGQVQKSMLAWPGAEHHKQP